MVNDQKEKASEARPVLKRTNHQVSAATVVALVALTAVVSFVLGTRADSIYAQIGPTLGFSVSDKVLDTSEIQDVYRKLDANFDGELDVGRLIEGAKTGLVAATDDPYTMYLDADSAMEFQDSLNGELSGVGAEIGVREGEPTILRVLDNSPAKESGLQAKDVIVGVNDKITTGLSPADVADMIRGEVDTTVKIFIDRDDEQKEFIVTRQRVSDPSVASRIVDGVGVLQIRRFDDETADLARRAAESFTTKDVKAVVLDLRDNGGGYLEAAQQLAGLWLTEDKVVTIETRNQEEIERLYAKGDPILDDRETVILTNAGTASASEVLAGSLRHHGAATIIGETTFGKGTIQQVISMSNGGELKVTIARWNLPDGSNIDEDGIKPDVEVELTLKDMDAYDDPQLEAALKSL